MVSGRRTSPCLGPRPADIEQMLGGIMARPPRGGLFRLRTVLLRTVLCVQCLRAVLNLEGNRPPPTPSSLAKPPLFSCRVHVRSEPLNPHSKWTAAVCSSIQVPYVLGWCHVGDRLAACCSDCQSELWASWFIRSLHDAPRH